MPSYATLTSVRTEATTRSPATATPGLAVTAAPPGLLQRACACGQSPGIDGECADCRARRLQRSSGPTTGRAVPTIVQEVTRASGQPLDTATRSFMEPRFGHDFGDVRVHTDSHAAESTQAVDALAYTLGRSIVFARDRYEPTTLAGRHLLAHELAHVMQQRGTAPGPGFEARAISDSGDPLEREASRSADAVLAAEPTPVSSRGEPILQRQERGASSTPASNPVDRGIDNPLKTVKIWLNAFLPATVSGKTIPAVGPHKGKTMIRGPIFSECYLTDNRTFNGNVIRASSRMHAEIEVDAAGAKEMGRFVDCTETYEIDCKSGAAVCSKKGRTADMTFSALRRSAPSLITFDMAGASNNPCYAGSPNIDYEGVVAIDVENRSVHFDGKIDDFPAFEMYAAANGGEAKTLFNTPPLPGKDPWNLPGSAARSRNSWARI